MTVNLSRLLLFVAFAFFILATVLVAADATLGMDPLGWVAAGLALSVLSKLV